MAKADDAANWMKKHKGLTIVGGIVLIVIVAASLSGGDKSGSDNNTNNNTDQSSQVAEDKAETPSQEEDLSQVAKEYTLTAGYYTAGVDLPAGVADVVAVSGNGNLSSSNIFNGGVNEMFGIDDMGTDLYTSDFKGLKFPGDTVLSINDDLIVKVTFTSVTSKFSGRSYDDAAAKTLSNGNYTAGTDFPAGTYKIVAVSGNGNLSSSNIYEGGVNEMFGVDKSMYNNQFLNAKFESGVTVTVSGGLTIKLTPAK